MLNNVTLQGRLTKDIELRYTNNQIAVASFTVACDKDFTGEDGTRGVDFISCVAWRQTAEFLSKYFVKGSLLALTGRLQQRSYEDHNGSKRTVTEVLAKHIYFCGKNNSSETTEAQNFEEINDEGELPF